MRSGHVLPLDGVGLHRRALGEQADFLKRAGLGDHQVMGHHVDVLEHDLDRLAGLDDDPVDVVPHLFEHGR